MYVRYIRKGEVTEYKNYKGIMLQDIVYDILTILIRNRNKIQTEEVLGEYHAGFRTHRLVIHQFFSMKQIFPSSYEFNLSSCMIFIDFNTAYDAISRKNLFENFWFPTGVHNFNNIF